MTGFTHGGTTGATFGGTTGGLYGARPKAFWLRLDRPDGASIELAELLDLDPVRTHTGKGDFEVTVPYLPSLEDWQFSELFLYFGGEFLFRGRLLDVESFERRSETVLGGDGVGGDLEAGEARVTYQNIETHNAISNYWSNQTGFSATVHTPSPTTVATDDTAQEADTDAEWTSIVSLAATDPLAVQNNQLEALQSCFTQEGEDAASNNTGTATSDTSASGGQMLSFDSAGESAEWTFTPAYDIPSGDFGLFVRLKATGGDPARVDVLLDGTKISEIKDTTTSFHWMDEHNSGTWSAPASDVAGGTQHTLRIEINTVNADATDVDVVAPADTRFSYTLDNSNGGSDGFLDGPELFPDSVQTSLATAQQSYNVTAGSANSTWNDTSGSQAIALSNDGGTTFTTTSNSATPDVTFSSTVGTTLTARLTFSRFGSRSTATPQTGFNGQTVGDWDLLADGDDLSVIDDLTVESNHLDNLQELHEFGGMHFVVLHDESATTAESFVAGTETGLAAWTAIDRRRRSNVRGYFNEATVRGALKGDGSGDRFETTVSDSAAIADKGVTRTFTAVDPTLESKGATVYRARSLLSEFVQEDDLAGGIQVFPVMVDPGFAYGVSDWHQALDGAYSLTAEGTDAVTVSSPSGLSSSAVAVAAQFRTAGSFQDFQQIFRHGTGAGRWVLDLDTNGRLTWRIEDASAVTHTAQSSVTLDTDTEYTAVASYDGSDLVLSLFSDEDESVADGETARTTAAGITLDTSSSIDVRPQGLAFDVDELMVYNQGLSSSSAAAIADDREDDATGRRLYWRFEEGSGSTVADDSGFGNQGTISNGTWLGSPAVLESVSYSFRRGGGDQQPTAQGELQFDRDSRDVVASLAALRAGQSKNRKGQ